MVQGRGLLQVAREQMRVRHLSFETEKCYLQWMRRFIAFNGRRHPRSMVASEVQGFLTHLAVKRGVAPSTQNQALQALLFLYKRVLGVELPWLDEVVRAGQTRRRPVVLSRTEVTAVIDHLAGHYRLIANLLYGSGLRLAECLRLRVKDLDLQRKELIVRDGVAHTRVDALVDAGTHSTKNGGGLVNTLQRDVRVHVTATEKHRRPVERAGVVAWRSGRANHTSAEPHDCGVLTRVTRGEFQRQTGALRESHEHDPFGLNPLPRDVVDQSLDDTQPRTHARLVLIDWRKKRVRIPRRPGCLRRQIGDVGGTELPPKLKDVLG